MKAVDRSYAAVVFDWDGTAVPDRTWDATPLRDRFEQLSRFGVDLAIISGTHLGNIDGQLRFRPPGPGRLLAATNRGSELFEITADGPLTLHRRTATDAEEKMLDRAVDDLVRYVASHGLEVTVVRDRMNRRKLDLHPGWTDPPKDEIARLLAAVSDRLRKRALPDLEGLVLAGQRFGIWAGLEEPKVTTDAKHIEIGLTDKGDAMDLVLDELAPRGVSPGLVLIAGDEFGPLGGAIGSDSGMLGERTTRATVISVGIEPEGVPAGVTLDRRGPEAFAEMLDDLIARYENHELPAVDLDPAWTITIEEPPGRRVSADAIFSLCDGAFGAREGYGDRTQLVAAGVYDSPDGSEALLEGPVSTDVTQELALRRRHLDLAAGVLVVEEEGATTVAFASRSRPGTHAVRTEIEAARADLPSVPLRLAESCRRGSVGYSDDAEPVYWARSVSSYGGSIATAARDHIRPHDGHLSVERVLTHAADPDALVEPEIAVAELRIVSEVGYDALLREQRTAWANAWSNAAVDIDGDPSMERATRFTIFHLLANAPAPGTTGAIGARGLSGRAYAGHVFWDTDVFVIPALTAIAPAGARRALRYRIDRLDAARQNAAETGCRGARFPWESAATGAEVTPRTALNRHGEEIEILTGDLEEHITADIAWAISRYVEWTGDTSLLDDGGAAVIVDAARYWASRVEADDDGFHISHVIGPDEYHENVDDNAFTNLMARWTLNRGAALTGGPEAAEWRAIADRIVDGYDPAVGIHEQHRGFSDLDHVLIGELHAVPVAADLLLGRHRTQRSQIIKQADVLMAHHLIPSEMTPGSLEADIDHYLPRTAHGSSLSPPVHAALLARAGRADEALELFRVAADLDLADLTATGAGGLHLATMGGLWQALVGGFAGMTVTADGIGLDPHLPSVWERIRFACTVRGSRVEISARPDRVEVTLADPLPVRIGVVRAAGTELRFDRIGERWEVRA